MENRLLNNVRNTVHFLKVDRKRVKKLQKILEEHHQRGVSFEEAEEVGKELVDLYECLAGSRDIVDHREDA